VFDKEELNVKSAKIFGQKLAAQSSSNFRINGSINNDGYIILKT